MILKFCILFLLFILWTICMLGEKFKRIDEKVYNFIKIEESYTKLLRFLTCFASTKFFVLLSFLMLIFMSDKSFALVLILLLIISSCLIESFKRIIRRDRPNINQLVYETGFSYPSGHMTSGTSFYGFLVYLTFISDFLISLKVVLIVCLVLLILIIGFSRIYLGVHYFSDVVGALLLASSYVAIYVYFVPDILNFVSNILCR